MVVIGSLINRISALVCVSFPWSALARISRANISRSTSLLLVLVIFSACNPNKNNAEKIEMKAAPLFNGDSAYNFVAKQVAFGPRVPTTQAHKRCGNWFVEKLQNYGATVTEQKDSAMGYEKKLLPIRNIIAAFYPEKKRRILLCAHWDSRQVADRGTERKNEPIDGANDGASGVGVLLEIARSLSTQPPNIGVDIVLFDTEDQGQPAYDSVPFTGQHFFCLGSIYWANNNNGYTAEYGILLDMVGAKNAAFTMEATSVKYAKNTLKKVWDTGNQLNYAHRFKYNLTQGVIDDHTYVNEIAKIPCINIIEYDTSTWTRFGTFWHTHNDNIDVIDSNSLKAVGQTVLQVIYNE